MGHFVWCIALVAAVAAVPAQAQVQVSDTTVLTYEVLMEEYDGLVKEAMALTDDDWASSEPVFIDDKAAMKPIHRREVDLILAFIKGHKTMDDDAAGTMMDALLEIQKDERMVTKEYQKTFQKVLPATLVLRFFQIDNRLNMVLTNTVIKDIPLSG
jgi:hypothetical protein